MDVAAAHSTALTDASAPALSRQRKRNKNDHFKLIDTGMSTSRGDKPKRRRHNLKQPLTKDMPRVLSELLNEPKVALLHRVVRNIGPKMAWRLLRETLRLEKDGGQSVNAVASGKPELFFVVDEVSHEYKPRRRTSGGVFLALLKEKVPKEVYRTIYEVEDKKKKDAKKRARNRQRQRMDHTLAKLGFDDLTLALDNENVVADAAMIAEDREVGVEDGEVVAEHMVIG